MTGYSLNTQKVMQRLFYTAEDSFDRYFSKYFKSFLEGLINTTIDPFAEIIHDLIVA